MLSAEIRTFYCFYLLWNVSWWCLNHLHRCRKAGGNYQNFCSSFMQMLNLINGNRLSCPGEKLRQRCTSLLLQFRGNGLWCSWTSFVWVPCWVRRTFFRCRHVVSRGGYAPLHRLTIRQAVMDHTRCCWPACRAETLFSLHFFLIAKRPCSTPFCRRRKLISVGERVQQLWWTDLYGGMKLSSAYPGTTSVRFYLAAFLQNSAGTQICRWFFSPPQTDMSS